VRRLVQRAWPPGFMRRREAARCQSGTEAVADLGWGYRMQGDVRFAVLGPVRAWRDETKLDLGQPQQRAVLAALLVREGAQATLAELIDGVWGDEAPAASTRAIRVYVYRLRQVLGSAGPGHIRSAGGGYLLESDPQLCDMTRFTHLVSRARRAREDGDPAAAAAHFSEGLAPFR
jgi:DNA-binding SARP family transcriptional activator